MSSEKHLEKGTGELSESKALLGYARSTIVLLKPRSLTLDKLAGHCSKDLSVITKRLKELTDQKGAYKLKYKEMINKRQIYDAVIKQRRTEEDENYNVILTARETRKRTKKINTDG
jgi:phosphopantetheine adenylyltransferase